MTDMMVNDLQVQIPFTCTLIMLPLVLAATCREEGGIVPTASGASSCTTLLPPSLPSLGLAMKVITIRLPFNEDQQKGRSGNIIADLNCLSCTSSCQIWNWPSTIYPTSLQLRSIEATFFVLNI